ncbi:unnamed protein product [Adineta ricciae]|uniref:RNA polymerase II-associated protein 1 n=1 Tax=Adineta ricciae TaxID=249248 RepID=A0A813PL61_ADIRI|nr:unnamed protein product [Adineta ricciae]
MNNDLQVRPKPKFGVSDDDEDEMLNYQELFQRSNLQPSAQVIREPKIKRQQSTENEDRKRKTSNIDLTETTVMRPIIVERDVSSTPIQLPKPINDSFPQAKYRGNEDDLEKITVPNVKKASMFAKQMYRDGKLKVCQELEEKKSSIQNEKMSHSKLLTGCGLGEVTGERELQRIHNENVERLNSMNENEILEEREKLLKSLDPKLIAFIRKRTKQEDEGLIYRPSASTAQPMDIENQKSTTIPIETDSCWLHMDKVEYEKLEWMKDLPTPSAQRAPDESNPDGVPARFDFKGNLMSRTADISVTAALHHHGEEPEAAGYTLEELFHLSRSAVLQQRVIALQTLANIIRQAHTGVYDLDLQLPLIQKLLEAGIVFLIRWAMDEQIEAIYMVAVECLANLIAPRKDEEILSRTTHWPCGYYEPSLTPAEIELGEKKSESDLTDVEILEQDLVKCLFRMNVLKRSVYLLNGMKLLPALTSTITVRNIFHILIRMARHSMTCANQIFEEKQLMDFIVQEFIPEFAIPNDEGHVYGHLLPEALKFCRVLANHGSTLTYNLIHRYELHKRLGNHLVAAMNRSLSSEDNQALAELFSLWRIFILQGHMADEFGSLIPTVILPFCRTCIQQMPNMMISQLLVQLIALFDALIIHITKFIMKHRNSSEEESNAINWSHIDGLFDIILTVEKQTLIETDEEIDLDALQTVGLSCLASFLIGQQLLTINLLDLPLKVHQIRVQFLEPLLRSTSMKKLIETVKLNTATLPTNSTRNLPTLTQTNISSFGFLNALLRLTNIIYQIDKSLPNSKKFITELMLTKNSEIVVYVKKMLNKLTSNSIRKVPWFEQFEHGFLFQFVQILYQEKSDQDLPSIYYEILLALLPSLLKGYHFLAQETFKLIFFDLSYWKRSNEIELADLSLITNESLHLASNQSIIVSSSQRTLLYERAIEHLPSLYTYYKNILHINRSSVDLNICDIHFGNLFQSDDLLKLNIHYSHTLLDITWPYGLLSSLYTNVLTIADENQRLELILNSLRFVYILEMKHSLILYKTLSKTTRFSMIAGIYLLGSEIFLEKNIADYLVAFLNCFNEQNLLQKLETKSNIQSLMTFFDFYRTLVDQYEACSFGDILYSNYLLIPLQQIYDNQLRKQVWIEHSTVLRYLRLKPDQILFPLEHFFVPYENDLEILRYYAQVLLNGTIQKSIQLFLYMIAVHHLNGFLFDQTRTEQFNLQRTIMKTIQSISTNNKILHDELVNYKTFSREGPVIFASLPSIRSAYAMLRLIFNGICTVTNTLLNRNETQASTSRWRIFRNFLGSTMSSLGRPLIRSIVNNETVYEYVNTLLSNPTTREHHRRANLGLDRHSRPTFRRRTYHHGGIRIIRPIIHVHVRQ